MKKNKGFTLIELLAVIVILAIIALIATPIVLNMINNARKKAAESSAYGFIDSIEYNNGFAQTEQAGYTEINGENLDVTSSIFNNLKLKGKKPSSGTVTIVNGKVTSANNLCFNNYEVDYDEKKVTEVKKGCDGSSTPSQIYTVYSVGQSINFDPVANESCTTPDSTTGKKTGCMKWYVISADDSTSKSTVNVILDHNTTGKIAYETSGTYKEYEQASIKLTVDKLITESDWKVTPRLIKADEIAAITGNDGWSSTTKTNLDWFCLDTNAPDNNNYCAKAQGASAYKWLFDYTNICTDYGCDASDSRTSGYWTSDAVHGSSNNYAWCMYCNGRLSRGEVNNNDFFGIRPVITLPKTALQ